MIQRKTLAVAACAAACSMFGGGALAQPAPAAKGPSAALALEAAQTALATCTANGFKVSVSVVDAAGVQKVLLAGDGAPAMGVTSSTRKAVTAVTFKKPTAEVAEAVKTDTALADRIKADSSLFARAGGQLLMSGGEVIGAIGVGGAPGGEKDDVCAVAGVAKIKGRL